MGAAQRRAGVLGASNLSKRYRRSPRLALDGVSVEIRPGALTAIVGPNGAGKSTLIRIWVGFEKPSSGRAFVGGHDPWRERVEALEQIAFVPQGAAFYRALTVSEHLDLAAGLRRRFDRAWVVNRLALLGIPLAQHATSLSGGQQAQLGLSIALGLHAPVLILDEPLASLDPVARREFLLQLNDVVQETGSTAVISSHVIADLDRICDRIVVLSEGRVRLDLDVEAVLATHRVVGGATCHENLIGSFPGMDGTRLSVFRCDAVPESEQPSLEDVVMGYLAAGSVLRADG